jgi:O-6-methylguanine DNA methyltransferase
MRPLIARAACAMSSRGGTVTEAIYSAGFNSNGRFYAAAPTVLGMTPTRFRSGGTGAVIRFAVGESSLGSILVAATDKGVCAITLGDDPAFLVRNLEDRFPNARLVGGDAEFEQLVARVVGFVETPALGLDLPLDVRGTAFQQRCLAGAADIPAGSTATYTEVARRIGAPKAVRGVAQACAANAVALAIPCRRWCAAMDASPATAGAERNARCSSASPRIIQRRPSADVRRARPLRPRRELPCASTSGPTSSALVLHRKRWFERALNILSVVRTSRSSIARSAEPGHADAQRAKPP